MALQTSGEISLNNLATEFGDSAPNSMSEFYSGGSLVANNAVNVNVPSSGAVSLSNYRGSAGTQTRNVSIRLSYTVPAGGSGFGLLLIQWFTSLFFTLEQDSLLTHQLLFSRTNKLRQTQDTLFCMAERLSLRSQTLWRSGTRSK